MKRPSLEKLELAKRSAKIAKRRQTITVSNFVASSSSALTKKTATQPFITRRKSISVRMMVDNTSNEIDAAHENANTNTIAEEFTGDDQNEIDIPMSNQDDANENVGTTPNDTNKGNVEPPNMLIPFLPTIALQSDDFKVHEPTSILDTTVPSTSNLLKPLVPINSEKESIPDFMVPTSSNLLAPLISINSEKCIKRPIPDLMPIVIKKKTYSMTKTGQYILHFLDDLEGQKNQQTLPIEDVNISEDSMDSSVCFGKLIYSDDSD